MRWHSPWILLEHVGTTWNLYDPIRTVLDSPGCALPPLPEMHSCTDAQLPPLSYNTFTCCGDLWGVLACVGILHTIGYYWNILEPPGTYTTLYEPSWILLGVPCPQYLKCIAALMCSYPRFHTIHSHALGTSGVCWHALASSIPSWNHLEPIRPYTNRPGFSWVCPAPST